LSSFLSKKYMHTNCFQEVLLSLDSGPSVGRLGIDVGMVDIYEGSITLLIAAEVLQLLPRAIPWEAGHDDVVDTGGIARLYIRHFALQLWILSVQ
jgi:hypothetical protein